jgi:hypothetical protein
LSPLIIRAWTHTSFTWRSLVSGKRRGRNMIYNPPRGSGLAIC